MTPIRATAGHAADLAALHAQAFPPAEQWGADAFALQLLQPGAYAFILLAAGQGGLVLARAIGDEAEVLTLAVTPAARNQGVGGCLLRAALDHAEGEGAGAMFLEVNPANLPAAGLYARAGFVLIGRRARYYPDGGDALVLRRPLSPGATTGDASRPLAG